MDDEFKFCYKCGAELPEGSDFCPECGASINRSINDQNNTEYTARPANSSGNLGVFSVLILVYGILAIIGAVFTIIVGMSINSLLQSFMDMINSGLIPEEYQEIFEEAMAAIQSMTTESLMFTFTFIGIVLIISGILAIIAGHYAGNRTNYKAALVLCLVAAGITFLLLPFDIITGIILPIVGLFMSYEIYRNKDEFTS